LLQSKPATEAIAILRPNGPNGCLNRRRILVLALKLSPVKSRKFLYSLRMPTTGEFSL